MNCIFSNSDCNGALSHRMPLAATETSAAMCEYHWTLRQHDVRVAASTGCTCWEGYERVPGTKPCAPGSCRKKNKKSAGEYMTFCPACGKRQAECEGHGNDAFRSLILQKHQEGNHVYCDTSCKQANKTVIANKENLIKVLKEVLGNAFSMYVRTHGAHWNVRGSDFAQYHELFETIYEDVYGSIDPLAENLRKLDSDAPASLAQFNDLDGLADAPESAKSEQELTKDVMDANRIVLESLQKAFDIANKENEQGIANFLAERIDMHQKWNWQLSSSFSRDAAVKDEPGFFEEEESFVGRKDDDEDIPKSEFDELITQEQRIQSDMRDNEDDANPRDKEDMTEFGRNASLKCAACGATECSGHEENSVNHMILIAHASEDHSSCHPDGCSSFGKSFHAHVCTNCGGDTPCVGTRTASICDTFDGFCKTCFVNLAGIQAAIDSKSLNKHMRKRNVRHQPPVTDAEVDRAMGAGHSLETAREEVGPHRPEAAAKPAEDDKLKPCSHCDGKGCDLCNNGTFWEVNAAKDSADSFVPPSSVANNAKRGLELRRKYHRGGTEIGVARARDLSNRKGLSLSTVKRMKAYFDRHEVDKKGEGWGKDSAGYIAWLLWGGDAGRSWANKMVKQHEKKSSTECEMCGQPSFVCNCDKTYSETPKFASNECGTCGHGWANHGKNASCPCCADFKGPKKASNELPDWLKEAAILIAEDAKVIDLDSYRNKKDPSSSHPSMNVYKKDPETAWTNAQPNKPKVYLYDQDDEVKLYDQDKEKEPIPDKEDPNPTFREQMKALGDWLGLTDDDTAPYDRRTDPRQYD